MSNWPDSLIVMLSLKLIQYFLTSELFAYNIIMCPCDSSWKSFLGLFKLSASKLGQLLSKHFIAIRTYGFHSCIVYVAI